MKQDSEFSMATKVDHVPPPWEQDMTDTDFISYMPSYEGGKYIPLFEKKKYPCDTVGDITYYVFDPVKNGAPADGKYPVLVWIHGATNALAGDFCVSHSGGELFASPEYINKMGGGAYIIVPLANEYRTEDGELGGSWSDEYSAPVKALIDGEIALHKENAGPLFVMGGSSGGYFSWRLAADYPHDFAGVIPISSGYTPTDDELDRIEAAGVHLLVAHGRHDELCPFDKAIKPIEQRLMSMKNCLCYFPEWVRNGDRGIASLNFGFEMGQHCLINQIQANLIYDDGSSYDDRLPDGVTGWICDVIAEVIKEKSNG